MYSAASSSKAMALAKQWHTSHNQEMQTGMQRAQHRMYHTRVIQGFRPALSNAMLCDGIVNMHDHIAAL